MGKLHFATETEATEIETDEDPIDCSWDSIVHGIERYAAYQPAGLAHDLYRWADLVEGIRQTRDGD